MNPMALATILADTTARARIMSKQLDAWIGLYHSLTPDQRCDLRTVVMGLHTLADELAVYQAALPRMALRQDDAFLAALSKLGFALVPAEPTTAMVVAAIERQDTSDNSNGLFYAGIYRAMIAAAQETSDEGRLARAAIARAKGDGT